MLIFNRQEDLKNHLKSVSNQDTTIGFVPTMGALHQGHLSLIKNSLAENNITVVSIFVNPTQFNNAEDLEKYPRTLEKDTEKIETVNKDVLIFAPSVEDIYEGNTVSASFDFDGLELASFYTCDNQWNQGEEIQLFDTGDVAGEMKTMAYYPLSSI